MNWKHTCRENNNRMTWKYIGLVGCCCILSLLSFAQQRIEPGTMNYVISSKPNSIFYRDTLYKGSAQFRYLFYRTRDEELISLYHRHQANKIAGQALGVAGSVAIAIGAGFISSADSKGAGWGLIGGGFAALLSGGYLIMTGQQRLQMAVNLFNERYHKTALGIGVSGNNAGLVYTF